jgi:uncharacterized membrane protein
MDRHLLGHLLNQARSTVFQYRCLSIARFRSVELVVVIILDFSLAYRVLFMLWVKITVMDNSVLDIVTQMISLRSSAVSRRQVKGLTKSNAVSGTQLRGQLSVKCTLGAGMVMVNLVMEISILNFRLDF